LLPQEPAGHAENRHITEQSVLEDADDALLVHHFEEGALESDSDAVQVDHDEGLRLIVHLLLLLFWSGDLVALLSPDRRLLLCEAHAFS